MNFKKDLPAVDRAIAAFYNVDSWVLNRESLNVIRVATGKKFVEGKLTDNDLFILRRRRIISLGRPHNIEPDAEWP